MGLLAFAAYMSRVAKNEKDRPRASGSAAGRPRFRTLTAAARQRGGACQVKVSCNAQILIALKEHVFRLQLGCRVAFWLQFFPKTERTINNFRRPSKIVECLLNGCNADEIKKISQTPIVSAFARFFLYWCEKRDLNPLQKFLNMPILLAFAAMLGCIWLH